LPRRQAGGTVRYHLVHSALAQWLSDAQRAGDFRVSSKKGHERLAEMGWKEFEGGVQRLSPYSLRHLPYHLAEAAKADRLTVLLTDLGFLEAKASAGFSSELLADLERAPQPLGGIRDPQEPRLALMADALRASLSFIAAHPESLFQCLWNECSWHDRP